MFSSAVADSTKARVLQNFSANSNLRVVISTVAFGMGVNVSDIRNIILWGIPEGLCHYWQQVGRACRDGRRGKAILHTVPVPNKLKTCPELKKLDQENMSQCIRLSVLKHLWVKEMGTIPQTEKCTEQCIECACSGCRCCVVCRRSCPCNQVLDDSFFQ